MRGPIPRLFFDGLSIARRCERFYEESLAWNSTAIRPPQSVFGRSAPRIHEVVSETLRPKKVCRMGTIILPAPNGRAKAAKHPGPAQALHQRQPMLRQALSTPRPRPTVLGRHSPRADPKPIVREVRASGLRITPNEMIHPEHSDGVGAPTIRPTFRGPTCWKKSVRGRTRRTPSPRWTQVIFAGPANLSLRAPPGARNAHRRQFGREEPRHDCTCSSQPRPQAGDAGPRQLIARCLRFHIRQRKKWA